MALLRPSLPPGERFGVLAEFATRPRLYHACEGVRDAGYTRWDAHAPFPVHGLDARHGPARLAPAVDRPRRWRSAAPSAGMGLQGWVSTIAYPLVISGKPFFSWPAFVPVTFELAVLGGALGAVFGMFALNQLPTLLPPAVRLGSASSGPATTASSSRSSPGTPSSTPTGPRAAAPARAPTHVELVASSATDDATTSRRDSTPRRSLRAAIAVAPAGAFLAPPAGRSAWCWRSWGWAAAWRSVGGRRRGPSSGIPGWSARSFALSIALGGLFFVLDPSRHARRAGASWCGASPRTLMATLPFLALLFVPLLFGMRELFHWSHAEAVAKDHLLAAQAAVSQRAVLPHPHRGSTSPSGACLAIWFAPRVAAGRTRPATTSSPARMRRVERPGR